MTQSKGAQLLVLVQPSVIDMTKNLRALSYEDLASHPAYSRERLSTTVADICGRGGISCLNLFPVFAENEPETLFFRGTDNHWNDAGQDLAARATAEYVHRSFLGE